MIFIYFHHPSSISNHQTSNAPLKKTVLRHKDPWKLWLPPPAPVVPAPAWPGWSALLWPCGPEWRHPTGPTGPRSACRCPKDLGSPRGTPTLEPSCRKSLQLAGWRSPGAWWRDSTSSANTFGQNASRVHVAYVVRMLMFWPTAWAKTCGWPIGQHAKNAYNFKTDLHQLCTIIVEFYIKLQAGTICKFPSQHPPTGNICQIICKYSPPKKQSTNVHEVPTFRRDLALSLGGAPRWRAPGRIPRACPRRWFRLDPWPRLLLVAGPAGQKPHFSRHFSWHLLRLPYRHSSNYDILWHIMTYYD